MRREELEHIVRASADIVGEPEVVVVGSQAILGTFAESELPDAAIASIEADIAFFEDPEREKADLVTGAIGELSLFHSTFGIYAEGVAIETIVLPVGWRDRVVVLETPNTDPARAVCLERHDLAASKLVAYREKDRAYVRALLDEGLLETDLLRDRIGLLPIDERHRARLRAFIAD
ncbi:MAG: hypothetical protein EHM57_06340 [Actinobacteria bacterium]|nr:MAG: hypothetical protein EHM57_06340 [Actinomycetota bacterium]